MALCTLFPVKVELSTATGPSLFCSAPPSLTAELVLKVSPLSRAEPKSSQMAPPLSVELLPANVEAVAQNCPWFTTAPPLPVMELFEKTTELAVAVSLGSATSTPPP